MKKVLIILSRIPVPAKDGGAMATLQLLKLYHKAGLQVDVLSLNTSKHFASKDLIEKELSFLNSIETVFADTSLNSISLLKNLFFTSKSYNLSRFRHPIFESLILNKIQSGNYDLVQVEGLYAASFLQKLPKKNPTPIVVRTHNVEHEIWNRTAQTHRNPFKRMYLKVMAQRLKKEELTLFAKAHAFYHISENDGVYFKKFFPNAKHINLPYSVPIAEDIERQSIRNSVGFIGSMEWIPNREGLQWFLDSVWPLVVKEIPEALFRIAGKGMEKEKFLPQAGLEIVGEVEDAHAFMKSCEVFVVPLFAGSGVRIKTLEAMSLGIPVAATSLGIQGILASSGKEILIGDTPSELAKHLISLFQSAQLRQTISYNAKQLLKQEHSEDAVIAILKKGV